MGQTLVSFACMLPLRQHGRCGNPTDAVWEEHSCTTFTPLLIFYTTWFQFHYSVEHVPGVLNIAADAISRNNISLLPSLIPQASRVQLPPSILEMLVTQRPD